MAKRANGEGNIRRRNDGTWEARVTVNSERKSVYGKTQTEVRKKMKLIIDAANKGVNLDLSNMTVSEWLQIWQNDFTNNVKQSTKFEYERDVRLHIVPYIGKTKLCKLTTPMVQKMYNTLIGVGLSPKSIKNTHCILHKALNQAMNIGYVVSNVCDHCELPVVRRAEMRPITDNHISDFLNAIKGNKYEYLLYVAMFTGLRESEIIGLSWDCIDFDTRKIRVYRQLSRERKPNGSYVFTSLKNGKERSFVLMQSVIDVLKLVKTKQLENRLAVGILWSNDDNLVFTDEYGSHLATTTVHNNFKKVAINIGLNETRFHDLRHTFATLSIEAGNDIKTVSASLGHATTAFTMDVYGHVSDKMQEDNADRMQKYIESRL